MNLVEAFRQLRGRIERQIEIAGPGKKPGLARVLARVKQQEREALKHVR